MVNMKRDESVEMKVWVNDGVFADRDWRVYTAHEGGHLYFMLQDPGSDTTMKVRISKHTDAKVVAPPVTDEPPVVDKSTDPAP